MLRQHGNVSMSNLQLVNAMREMEKRENYLNGFPRFVELSGRLPEHLCRTMRLYYGKSPQQWIIELRLQDAAVLLEPSSMNVSGNAHASGVSMALRRWHTGNSPYHRLYSCCCSS